MSNLKRARFSRLVARALDELPAEFRDRLRNVDVVILDEPRDEQRPEDGSELLGLYEGVPLTGRGSGEPYLPDRISIFRGPIERMTASPKPYRIISAERPEIGAVLPSRTGCLHAGRNRRRPPRRPS